MMYSVGYSLLLMVTVWAASVTGLSEELTSGSSCFERAQQSSGRGLMGGYRPVNNPASNDDVGHVLRATLTRINSMSNGGETYELNRDANGNVVQPTAYRQLVNGLNFCVRFSIQQAGCGQGSEAGTCSNDTPKQYVCDALAYRSFTETVPALVEENAIVCG